MKFVLTTDTSCDEFKSVLDGLNVPWIPLTFTIDGEIFDDNFSSDGEYKDFYKKLDGGAMPTTSQINIFAHEEFFERVLAERNADSIVHLTLSGGLSDTANSARKAAENYMSRNPQAQIYIVDTLSATQGHNLLLYEAIKLRDNGVAAGQAFEEIEKLKTQVHAWFMVDNLHHLKRGGRVSGASAAIGTILNIKPILIIDGEGKLSVVKKVKGTANALNFFLETIERHRTDATCEFFLVHSNAHKEIDLLKKQIEKKFSWARPRIGWLGPIIGTHCGAGLVGMTFIGKEKLTV